VSNWIKGVGGSALVLAVALIRLVVASTDPSRPPFGNVYERGTFPGVETVVVSLVFDVVAAPPDTVLQVRNVVVD